MHPIAASGRPCDNRVLKTAKKKAPIMFDRLKDLTKAICALTCAVQEAGGNETATRAILKRMAEMEKQIMITQAELAAGLKALQSQVGKVAKEQSDRFDALTAKVKELQDLIDAGGTINAEVESAFQEVKTALQSLDDVIPDAPVEPPVEPPTA